MNSVSAVLAAMVLGGLGAVSGPQVGSVPAGADVARRPQVAPNGVLLDCGAWSYFVGVGSAATARVVPVGDDAVLITNDAGDAAFVQCDGSMRTRGEAFGTRIDPLGLLSFRETSRLGVSLRVGELPWELIRMPMPMAETEVQCQNTKDPQSVTLKTGNQGGTCTCSARREDGTCKAAKCDDGQGNSAEGSCQGEPGEEVADCGTTTGSGVCTINNPT